MLRALLGLTAVLTVFGRPAGAAATPSTAADARLGRAVDAYVKPFLERDHLSGRLLVARNGRIVLERSWGYAQRELGVPVTPQTRFCVASVTKPMTLHVAFRLMEAGKIGYRDSIARWFPDFPRGDRITIEHLLRHRSGIPHELIPDSLATRPRTAAEMVEIAKGRPLDFEPGSESRYSSGGFTVLARILEIAGGKDYQALLEEHLFGPLGMTHSIHRDRTAIVPDRAQAYETGPDGIENARFQDLSELVGAGSVWSTPRDLHAFVQATVSGRLGESLRQSLVRSGRLDLNGRTNGYRAFATWDSATGLEVIYAGNLQSGAADHLKGAVPRLAAGEQVTAPALPALAEDGLPPERLQPWVGTFQLGNGTRLHLHVRDNRLVANDWPLLPTRDGAFFSPRDYGIVRGVAGPDGRIERLDWLQGGETYPAPRVAETTGP